MGQQVTTAAVLGIRTTAWCCRDGIPRRVNDEVMVVSSAMYNITDCAAAALLLLVLLLLMSACTYSPLLH